MLKKKFSFIEAPVYQGQKHFGVSLGPGFLRQSLLDQHFKFDFLPLVSRQSAHCVQASIYEELSYLTERESRRGQLTFVAGGDHSLSIGSIQGLLRKNPNLKVLWIDAHGDVNTTASSITQSFHGMPLSFLLGIDPFFQKTGWFEEQLKPENLIYFGLRDLDLAEKKFLDTLKIQHYSADEVLAGSENIICQIQTQLAGHDVHISLDADAFDPAVAPATGVPVQNGLQFRDVENLVEKVLDISQVNSFEYVELNPQIFKSYDDVFKTAQVGIEIFKMILQKHQAMEVARGFNDRFSHSEKPSLHDSHFELEKQSSFADRLWTLSAEDGSDASRSDSVL